MIAMVSSEYHPMLPFVSLLDVELLSLKELTNSSSYNTYNPRVVVDGNTAATWSSGSCFASAGTGDPNPWLTVKLDKLSHIKYVSLRNRDDCCGRSTK